MLQNKFTLRLTKQVDINKYESRILALATAYRAIPNALHISSTMLKSVWRVLPFKEISATGPEISSPKQGDFKKVVVDMEERITFFAVSGSVQGRR